MRDVFFACALTVAFVLVALGVDYYSRGAGLIVSGVLLAVLAWLLFGEVNG